MKFIEIVVEYADIANFLLLIVVLASLLQNRVLQKKQFRFEKSKLFHNEKKEMYSAFLSFYRNIAKGKKMPEISQTKFMEEFIDKIRIYGDADVVYSWNRFMTAISSPDKLSDTTAVREAERLLRALRKNMGHDDSKLRAGSIMATHIIEGEKGQAFDACEGETYKWLNDD